MPFIARTAHRRHLLALALLAAIPLAAVVGGLLEASRIASAASAPQPQRIDLAAGYPSVARGYRLSLTEAALPPGAGFAPRMRI